MAPRQRIVTTIELLTGRRTCQHSVLQNSHLTSARLSIPHRPIPMMPTPHALGVASSFCVCFAAADWPQWGGSPARTHRPRERISRRVERRPVRAEDGPLVTTTRPATSAGSPGSARQTYGSPVIADGKVFCATNNGAGWLKRYPPAVDLGCLLCFRQSDGQFHWQLSREKLAAGRALDYPDQGICCCAAGRRQTALDRDQSLRGRVPRYRGLCRRPERRPVPAEPSIHAMRPISCGFST